MGNKKSKSMPEPEPEPELEPELEPEPEPELESEPEPEPGNNEDEDVSEEFEPDIVVAVCNHEKRDRFELAFVIGDRFEVLEKRDLNWWWSRSLDTKLVGYIAVTHVVPANSLKIQEWFHGDLSRKKAEKCLLEDTTYPCGTFLVRNAESNSRAKPATRTFPIHVYSLSLKNSSGRMTFVIHHRIFKQANECVYIHTNKIFKNLVDLIQFYFNEDSLSNLNLTMTCPKTTPSTPIPNAIYEKDQWEIDRASITFTEKIGSGHFGEVWHGYLENVHEVAVKTLKEGTMPVDAFLDEAKIMKTLRHQNILMLYAVCTLTPPIFIITEFMNRGSLLDVLQESGHTLEIYELVEISAQVALGMSYIEDKGLIHRDLAARNILLDSEKQCKIADFGLARAVDGGIYSPNPDNRFPVRWTAPEVIKDSEYSIRSDVWSFSIVLMEIFTLGKTPYSDHDNRKVSAQVPCGLRMKQPSLCPDPLFEMVQNCWNLDPIARPTFDFMSTYLSEYAIASEVGYAETSNMD